MFALLTQSGHWRVDFAVLHKTVAGPGSTRRRCDGMRRNSSHCNPTLFSRMTPPPLRRCCNKREPFPLFSRLLPILSAAVSWRASRGRAATPLVLQCTKPRSAASGWSYLRRQYRTFPGSSSFSTGNCAFCRKSGQTSVAVEVSVAHVHDVSELETVVATQAREPNSGLIVLNEDFMIAYRVEIISLAARYHLPAVYPFRFFAELGGLISYGVDLNDNFRRAVHYADRVLRGAKPSELPVQAPVKFELVINLKTAKAISIDVPLQLKQRADEVIE